MTTDRSFHPASQPTQMIDGTGCCSTSGEFDVERVVRDRYGAAAKAVEPELCCPVDYGDLDLSHVPAEVIERDYGCGNPAPFVRAGDTVLDLGSGPGKMCFAVSKLVGSRGRVIGVDCNAEMLELARGYRSEVAETLGYSNVEFRYGMIQDLQLDLELLASHWRQRPIVAAEDWLQLRNLESDLRASHKLIADASVDCVISNCVLNLVRKHDRHQLFAELFRVLRDGGRAAISDIVCDRDVPVELQNDPELWSGCISGAFREDEFVEAFRDAGFGGIEIARLETTPWRTVAGIEFRAMTLVAHKPATGERTPGEYTVIYRGPFSETVDEQGTRYELGRRVSVDEATYRKLMTAPYAEHFIGNLTIDAADASCCGPSGGCC